MRFRLLFTVAVLVAPASYSQDIFGTLSKAATKGAADKGTKMRESLDSIDFQFAMSVNENAGFFDIEQKGETGAKILYSLKEDADKTLVEKLRPTLDAGIGLYDIRRYKLAEDSVGSVKD